MKSEGVDAYISLEEPWKQAVLKEIRKAIHRADPDINEVIKWGAPSFELAGQVVWLFGAVHWVHVSFRQGAILKVPNGTWEEDETSESKAKRTIKVMKNEQVPVALIEDLVRQAVANNLVGKKVDLGVAKARTQEFELPKEYELWLREAGMLDKYQERPYYQQRGWVQWIELAKTLPTKQKRMRMVLIELKYKQYMPNAKDRHKE